MIAAGVLDPRQLSKSVPGVLRKRIPASLRKRIPASLWRKPVIVVLLTYLPAVALGPLAEGLTA
ncbi:hypothetical protein [Dactylosporangium sp. NPDC051541]|uniref:hypothetical protein n=1 Tax=Dactylosporangium sp. NPDC051541 TaxID=3363977 RepID=UPI0037A38A2A